MNVRDLRGVLLLACALSTLVGCATSSGTTATANARRYRVRAHRPVPVGFRFRIEGRGELRSHHDTTDRFGRRVNSEEEIAGAEFAGDATVRAVDEDGYVSAVVIDVRRAMADDGETTFPFIPAGSVITISASERDGEMQVTREGSALDRASMQYLSLAYDIDSLYGFRAEYFGANRRRAVGERWPVPAIRMTAVSGARATAERADGTVETADIPIAAVEHSNTAEATLARLVRVDGVSCLELRTTSRIESRHPNGAINATHTSEWTMMLPRARRRPPMGMGFHSTTDSWSELTLAGRPLRDHLVAERTMVVRFAEIQ